MKILVIGGTRYFGVHMVKALAGAGHQVTVATRGNAADPFGASVSRVTMDRTNADSVRQALGGMHFDVVMDQIAYSSNDVRCVLDHVTCGKYILTSSGSVYEPLHRNAVEEELDPLAGQLVWCGRDDYPYAEIKRQAEYALWQQYPEVKKIAVRFPYVVGSDDYTRRLLFYVEHVAKGIPMYVDDMNSRLGFIRSDEAGQFLAFLAEQDVEGPVNASAAGTMSVGEIIHRVEEKTGMQAVLSESGEPAPYNGTGDFSLNTDKAEQWGYTFTVLKDWMDDLLDELLRQVREA